jgi:hypothetical protein
MSIVMLIGNPSEAKLLIGIVPGNVNRLLAGDPMYIRRGRQIPKEGLPPKTEILIVYGDTHIAIFDQLTAAGLQIPSHHRDQAQALDAELAKED